MGGGGVQTPPPPPSRRWKIQRPSRARVNILFLHVYPSLPIFSSFSCLRVFGENAAGPSPMASSSPPRPGAYSDPRRRRGQVSVQLTPFCAPSSPCPARPAPHRLRRPPPMSVWLPLWPRWLAWFARGDSEGRSIGTKPPQSAAATLYTYSLSRGILLRAYCILLFFRLQTRPVPGLTMFQHACRSLSVSFT